MNIKSWIVLLTNSLIIITTIILSIFFYREFHKTIDERVLLQLKSIKRLKRVQIESYLNEEWDSFESNIKDGRNVLELKETILYPKSSGTIPHVDSILLSFNPEGIHDITQFSENGKVLLLFIYKADNDNYYIRFHQAPKIQNILLERTGMGQTGETYIVGEDYHLRTESRFYSEKAPFEVVAKTKLITSVLNGKGGNSIIKDYRDKDVYSAYHSIVMPKFKWVILSEIDLKEATKPLSDMRDKLVFISASVLFFVILISIFLTNKISKPINKVSSLLNKMANGQYDVQILPTGPGSDVKQLYESLIALQETLKGAIVFANDIGSMNLESTYKAAGKNDPLGESLITMRDKLKEFQSTEIRNQQISKQSLIKGQENERKRLSQELHDGLGPLLTSIKLMVQGTAFDNDKKTELKKLIDDIIQEVRAMSYDLMPQALLDFGVGKSVMNWISLIKKTTNIDVQYQNEMLDFKVQNQEINICLFRVIQELFNNTIKHSDATSVKLSLTEFDDKVSLYYHDNGKGFNIEDNYSGSGLINMKERIEVLNGYFFMNSNYKGTEIEVELPVK